MKLHVRSTFADDDGTSIQEESGLLEKALISGVVQDADLSACADLGKVSLVGAGMQSHPGVATKGFATLEAAGIEAAVASTSPINFACPVTTTEFDRAVQALHEAFDRG